MKYETLLEYSTFPLYHSARVGNVPNLLDSEILKIPKDIGWMAANASRNPGTISFSRDINHPFYRKDNVVLFTFDKNKLRHNFKLTPHIGDWIMVTRDEQEEKEWRNRYRENEERAVKSIPNFGKYLINIMLPKQMYSAYYAEKQREYSREVKYKYQAADSWIKYLKDFAAKYNLPVIPYKGQSNESVLESMLEEDQVFSSWIDDLSYIPDQEAVLMTLLSGRNYTVYDMGEEMFDAWIDAPSQGKFWHEYIRDFHQVM